MQNDSTPQNAQAEIPAYLQCEPRYYKVKYNDDTACEIEFKITIKCTDEMLHEHNNFWSGHKDRLEDNNNDIVAVMLKMIGRHALFACFEGKDFLGVPPYNWGINTLFKEEGWMSDCFEITWLWFEDYISYKDFEFEPVMNSTQEIS